MVLVKNLKFFHLFIFGKIRQENVFDDIRERKKACLDHEKQKVKKVAESAYFQRGYSMVLVKSLKVSIFLFSTKSDTKMCLMIF